MTDDSSPRPSGRAAAKAPAKKQKKKARKTRARETGPTAVDRPADAAREDVVPSGSNHDPDVIRRVFKEGRLSVQGSDEARRLRAAQGGLAVGAAEGAAVGEGVGDPGRRPVRGTRRGRQGRHHQAVHGAPEPARRPRRGPREAHRARTRPVVLPALHRASAGGGRDRPVRPVLVQPRRGRAGDGLLHRFRVPRVHAPVPRARAHARQQRHPALQVLVLRLAGGTGAPLRPASDRPPEAVEDLARRPRLPRQVGTAIPRPRRRCSSMRIPPTRLGR